MQLRLWVCVNACNTLLCSLAWLPLLASLPCMFPMPAVPALLPLYASSTWVDCLPWSVRMSEMQSRTIEPYAGTNTGSKRHLFNNSRRDVDSLVTGQVPLHQMSVIFQLCNKQSCLIFQLRRTKFECLGFMTTCYEGSSHNVTIYRWFTITGAHHDNKMWCWGPTNCNNPHFMVWCGSGVYCKLTLLLWQCYAWDMHCMEGASKNWQLRPSNWSYMYTLH